MDVVVPRSWFTSAPVRVEAADEGWDNRAQDSSWGRPKQLVHFGRTKLQGVGEKLRELVLPLCGLNEVYKDPEESLTPRRLTFETPLGIWSREVSPNTSPIRSSVAELGR
ncbi:uncharacterized protein METZ01_LOCUS219264 [marine metagenome]|uniref:Uncharacterized protein n=1 Tax=marine metagenome TaxID=408172 RepID=A0A382FTV5_9ZZZZ